MIKKTKTNIRPSDLGLFSLLGKFKNQKQDKKPLFLIKDLLQVKTTSTERINRTVTPDHHCIDQKSVDMSVASFVSLLQIAALTQQKRDANSLTNRTLNLPVIARDGVTVFAMVAVTGSIHPNV